MVTNLRIHNESINRIIDGFSNHYIPELNLKHFWRTSDYGPALSKRNRKFYKIRKQNHNKSSLEKVEYNTKDDVLNLFFKVTPTFGGGTNKVKSTDLKGKQVEKDYYTVIIQFQKIKEVIGDREEWDNLRPKEKREFTRDLIKYSDVKFHSNDMSFLMQGTWYRLQELDSCIFPFPSGLKDTGAWEKKHGQSIYLTKHFINVFNTLLIQTNVTKIIKGMDSTYK